MKNMGNVKTKALKKALRGRQVAAYLKTWTGGQRKDMEEHGLSREEMLEGLVPACGTAGKGCQDPAVKALEDFIKLHKTMEVARGKVLSRWLSFEEPCRESCSRELVAKRLVSKRIALK